MPLNWPKSANALLHWKSALHYGDREAQRGKKAIPVSRDRKVHRDQKGKGASPVARVLLVLREREATPVARACPARKAHKDLQGRKGRGASPVARACPARKAHRDPRGQKGIPADPTRLQQFEDRIFRVGKTTGFVKGMSCRAGRRTG